MVPTVILDNEYMLNFVLDEICIHRELNHENIVKFTSFFQDDSNIYIVLELCPHQTLKELLQERESLSEHECRYFITQIMQGVRYLHQQMILHRDLKLANIFLGKNLVPKIGDFGLSTLMHLNGKRFEVCGTVNYFAPEILYKCGYSFPADVWAVGVIMYMLLVGRPPFSVPGKNDQAEVQNKIMNIDYR